MKKRRQIYKQALLYLRGEEDTYHNGWGDASSIEWQKADSGLCELLSYAKGDYNADISDMEEFFLFTPDKNEDNAFWWKKEDRKVREICLLFCMEMTKT